MRRPVPRRMPLKQRTGRAASREKKRPYSMAQACAEEDVAEVAHGPRGEQGERHPYSMEQARAEEI